MSRHFLAFIFFGVGFCGLMFSLLRTYYLVWKLKKERDARSWKRPPLNKPGGE
ncbi:MAG TPA: hypothetical protein VMV05_04095 [bacterium]|nr:hypothetical protein [bacterium]